MLLSPGHNPLRCYLFGQGARACVVRQDFAGPLGAERSQHLVKANSAMTVRVFVGAVTQRDHAVDYAGEVRLLTLQAVKECLCIVGNITLSIGGSANQEGAPALRRSEEHTS